MGADTVSSHLIFFIAATVVAVAASGIFSGVIFDLAGKAQSKGKSLGSQLASEITIINDPRKVPNNPFIAYVKNTGSETLDHNRLNMILDGSLQTGVTLSFPNGETVLSPTVVVAMTKTGSLSNGDHWLRVVTENGIYDEIRFRV